MPETKPADPSDGPVCDRCNDPLDESHWIHLFAAHQGPLADRYLDAERRICVDCLAAMGMLAFAVEPAEDPQTDGAGLRDRLSSIRPLRGDN